MTSRKYIFVLLSLLYMFLLVNVLLWFGDAGTTFKQRDLNRMGNIIAAEAVTKEIHYEKHHTNFADYAASGRNDTFDVLTIGDSFTNGKDGGSYPDYLVNQYGLKVINASVNISALRMLDESGWLDKISPKVVVLEIVGRSLHYVLGRKIIDTSNTGNQKKAFLPDNKKTTKHNMRNIIPPMLIQVCIRHIDHKLYHLLHPDRLSPEVYITKLDRPFFTNRGQEDILLHFRDDLNYINDPLNAEMVNQNLNATARFLKAKGIKLIFFAAADKYDLYYPYIIDKKGRPENPLFQKMRDVPGKEYTYIDTITPLRQALERGEQDIYWLGDTHWSHRGIKIFCDELVKYILPELH